MSLKPRCRSALYLQEGGIWTLVKCSYESTILHHEHRGRHEGFFVDWNSEEATHSKELWSDDVEKIHTRSEPFVGWRCWKLKQQLGPSTSCHVFLESTAAKTPWYGPTMGLRLGCNKVARLHHDISVFNGMDYGIYSYKQPQGLVEHFAQPNLSCPIIGRLDVSGHVVEHEIGWRSSKVIIRELWVISFYHVVESYEGIRESLEETYQCPVNIIQQDQVVHWAKFYSEEGEK
jgi:hypothetical protein